MPYAALIVHFDAAPSAHRRVHLAVHLANRFQAAMIGIAGRSYVPTLMAEGLTIDSEKADCGQDELAILADIGREFNAATRHVTHTWMFGGVTHQSGEEPALLPVLALRRKREGSLT
jgi:hypothetical protein